MIRLCATLDDDGDDNYVVAVCFFLLANVAFGSRPMAFSRRRYGTRRFRSRVRRSTSGFGFRRAKPIAGRLQPRLVRSAPLRAVHFYSAGVAGAFPQTNGTGYLLNAVQRGTGIENRNGNRIRMMSLIVTGGIMFNPYRSTVTATTPNISPTLTDVWQQGQDMSLLIFYCPQPLTTLPLLSDYFQPNLISSVVDTWSLPRINDIPTMRLLYRKNFAFKTVPNGNNSTTVAFLTAPPHVRPVRVKLSIPMMTHFNNTSFVPVIGDIASGSLLLYLLGDYPSGSGPATAQRPIFNFEYRLAFTDVD